MKTADWEILGAQCLMISSGLLFSLLCSKTSGLMTTRPRQPILPYPVNISPSCCHFYLWCVYLGGSPFLFKWAHLRTVLLHTHYIYRLMTSPIALHSPRSLSVISISQLSLSAIFLIPSILIFTQSLTLSLAQTSPPASFPTLEV